MPFAPLHRENLPSAAELQAKLRSLAMLDAILMPDWEMRYFSFNSQWSPGMEMASMRDGEGNESFFVFDRVGVAGKIYAKGQQLADASRILAGIPADFVSFLKEPAFTVDLATCYLWQYRDSPVWAIAPEATTGIPFMAFVTGSGEYYHAWAQDYYEIRIPLEPIAAIFQGCPLTSPLVAALNPETDLERLLPDCHEIGYPV